MSDSRQSEQPCIPLPLRHLASSLLYVASLIFVIVLCMRNPMLSEDIDPRISAIVPDSTAMTRQIDPAKMKIPWAQKTTDVTVEAKDQIVYKYIKETLLSHTGTPVSTISNDPVSPMHKTMLLMGCYGYRWGSMAVLLENQLVMQPQKNPEKPETPALFVNFMLQAFDNNYTKTNNDGDVFEHFSPYDTYDKSVCNCLRDFATPSLLDVDKSTVDGCDLQYTHDSCSSESLFDYAIDGSGLISTNSEADKNKMRFPAATNTEYTQNRHRRDPILQEIETYTTNLGVFGNNTVSTKPNLNAFIIQYCQYSGYGSAELDCPAAWAGSLEHVKISDVLDQMKKWTAHMHTYNKLRTPTLDVAGEMLSQQLRYANSVKNPPKITRASFQKYIEKYQAAFETCARVGVPRYSTQVTGHTKAAHWYLMGELFLLLASILSFSWAWIVYEHIPKHAPKVAQVAYGERIITHDQNDETSSGKVFHNVNNFIVSVFGLLMPIVLIVLILAYGGQYSLETLETYQNNDDSANGKFLDGFVWVSILLGAILCACFCVFFCFMFGTYTKQSAQTIKNMFLCCCKTPDAPVSVYGTLDPLTMLQDKMFLTQISLDLPIILGLAFMAVGTTLQRGVGDYSLIVTVILLFTTLGLTTHITNVLRLLHMHAQAIVTMEVDAGIDHGKEQRTATYKKFHHVTSISYNRVLIGVLIALMLYIFLNLAGLDTVQGQSFLAWHQIMFAIAAFVILTFGDLSLELFCLFTRRKSYAEPREYFYDSVKNKSKNTAWLILLSLFVLQYHQRMWLCPRSDKLDLVGDNSCWL